MAIAAALQMNSSDDIRSNLAVAAKLLEQAAQHQAQLCVLPENFALMRQYKDQSLKSQERFGQGPIQDFLKEQAYKHNLWIIGGTIPLTAEATNKTYAACLVFNNKGECVGQYNKIHLFDVNLGSEQHQESETIQSGTTPLVVETPIGKVGIAVCYDVRFPKLFHLLQQQGAEIFALPSAFTVPTGQAHWEVLTRCRAIENLCYLIASCQTGLHNNGRRTFGHSEIIDPWGKLVASLADGEGIITAEINLTYLYELRKKLPVINHHRL